VAVGNENIEQASLSKSRKPAPQARNGIVGVPSRRERYVGEICVAIVAIESFIVVGERGDEEVELAVAIVIADADAHGSLRAALLIDGEAAEVTDVFERAVAMIAIEVIGSGIVWRRRDRAAVVVEIDEERSEAVAAFAVGDPGFDADVGERTVAIVVEKMIAFSEESIDRQKTLTPRYWHAPRGRHFSRRGPDDRGRA